MPVRQREEEHNDHSVVVRLSFSYVTTCPSHTRYNVSYEPLNSSAPFVPSKRMHYLMEGYIIRPIIGTLEWGTVLHILSRRMLLMKTGKGENMHRSEIASVA